MTIATFNLPVDTFASWQFKTFFEDRKTLIIFAENQPKKMHFELTFTGWENPYHAAEIVQAGDANAFSVNAVTHTLQNPCLQ